MDYPEVTGDQKQQITNLFDSDRITFSTEPDGYRIHTKKMYEYVSFHGGISTLQGYLKIAEILGCDSGDEVSRYATPGCETCDYGSSYEVTLRFWRNG